VIYSIEHLHREDDTFFMYDTHKRQDGAYFITEPCKLNAKQGLSGQMIRNDLKIFSDNNPRINARYAPEIDNCVGAPFAKNLMIG